MSHLCSFFAGAFLAIALFATFKFTPEVSSEAVERAISVCKEGKWMYINNVDIVCTDGAVYPRTLRAGK